MTQNLIYKTDSMEDLTVFIFCEKVPKLIINPSKDQSAEKEL